MIDPSLVKVRILKCTLFLGITLLCGGQGVGLAATSTKDPEPTRLEIANNAYSLLYQLLLEEKNLDKILALSKERKSIDPLVREISHTSNEAVQQLEKFQLKDRTLYQATHLPPGEIETRKAISETKMKDLVLSSGDDFTIALLLTQTEALTYASHLAFVASINDDNSERSELTLQLSKRLEKLLQQVTQLLTPKK